MSPEMDWARMAEDRGELERREHVHVVGMSQSIGLQFQFQFQLPFSPIPYTSHTPPNSPPSPRPSCRKISTHTEEAGG